MCFTARRHRRSVAGSPHSQVHAPPPRAHDARGVRTRGFLSGWRPRGACSWRGTMRPCSHLGDHHHLGTTAQNKSHWFRDLLRVRSRTVGARTQRCRFFLLPLLLLRQGSTVYRRRRLHVSHLAYVIVGRLDFLDIWPLYPPLGHGTVHHSSGCTNWLPISLVILLNE